MKETIALRNKKGAYIYLVFGIITAITSTFALLFYPAPIKYFGIIGLIPSVLGVLLGTWTLLLPKVVIEQEGDTITVINFHRKKTTIALADILKIKRRDPDPKSNTPTNEIQLTYKTDSGNKTFFIRDLLDIDKVLETLSSLLR